MNPIPVIDIFAGPGGLGEGFSALKVKGKHPFRIALSIEKDPIAHQTLKLRAFFRQFRDRNVPDEYYLHLRGKFDRQSLFELFPKESSAAAQEAWCAALGETPNDVVGKRIESALNGAKNWVLIGGPPCQAYSTAGKGRRSQSSSRKETDFDPAERDLLYQHYLEIVGRYGPSVFVMENVKGILSASRFGKKLFRQICEELISPPRFGRRKFRYRLFSLAPYGFKGSARELTANSDPRDFLLRAELHGVPQNRHRVIIVGVRNDIVRKSGHGAPKPLQLHSSTVTTEEMIQGLPPFRSVPTDENANDRAMNIEDHFALFFRKNGLLELAASSLSSRAPYGERIACILRKCRLDKCALPAGKPDELPEVLARWIRDPRLYVGERYCFPNHKNDRSHLTEDLARYFFFSCYGKVTGTNLKLNDEQYPDVLLPKHKNLFEGEDVGGKPLPPDKRRNNVDRFQVQLAGMPSATVTCHCGKDGHHYIHYDPRQCRSMSVRELARIQTFPDNYLFCGARTAQYHQVGNAVPPYLAHQIAASVFRVLDRK